ncbi:MAG TPA: tryptophan 7-halogenase [Vicinamibacterales bacterium]|nr:tryptophan 7-halogenase [Vicinamibacterales bacterium]
MSLSQYDAIIVGAGPAGCAAARLLAAWHHRVLLVDKPGGQSRTLAESIPPSAQKLLATLGMLATVEDAGFVPWRGNTVWWADAPPRVESFAAGTAGYQVVRRRFDDLLRDLAVQSGADVRPGLVRDVSVPSLDGEPAGADPSVLVESDGHSSRVTAPMLLDCSGRAGVIARKGLRDAGASPPTVALVGVWQDDAGFGGANPTHTLVASYGDGWAWSVPTAPGVRYVTMMIDPARTALARGGQALDVYRAELGKVAAFEPLWQRARLIDGPWGADASTYSARRFAGADFLLAGDAGSFIDPLSSFGVKKALASGWLAAVVTHTALRTPSMRDQAVAFFDRRERELAVAAMRLAGQFAADVAAGGPRPFWLARATSPAEEPEEGVDAAALAQDPSVVAAFQDLRRRPRLNLRRGPTVAYVSRPAIRGLEIVMDDHLQLPRWPEGLRYLRNVDLITLARLAPNFGDVGQLYEALARIQPDVLLPDFLGALSVLIEQGALEHAD